MARIAILDVAAMPAPDLSPFGSVARMVQNWLGPHLAGHIELVGINVAGGEALPRVAEFDGFILPGSEAGVYDERDWMAPLRALLLQIREAEKPLLGICFGHQMMAHSFGGEARKVDQGFCLGVREFQATDGGRIRGHVAHQDQVVSLPPGALVEASAEYCPIAELSYDFPAMSLQFHPEYRPGFIQAVANLLQGELMSPEAADAARQSVAQDPAAPDLYASKVADFFARHLPQ